MSRNVRVLGLCILAVFAIGAAASASASAFNLEWQVCKTGGTEKFETNKCAKTSSGGTFSFQTLTSATETAKVVDRGTANFVLTVGTKIITCTKETSSGTITGGKPGTDSITITFSGCTTSESGCSVKSAGEPNGTIVVASVPTVLVERKTSAGATVEADEFKENATTKEFVTLKFEGTCTEFPETKVKGNVAGETATKADANGNYNILFPSPELKGNTLEAFGKAAKFTGEAENETEAGTAKEVEEHKGAAYRAS